MKAKLFYTDSRSYKVLIILIASVWLINGLFCKLINLVPRHQLIVAKILGTEHSAILTKMIGLGEIFIGLWALSMFKPRLCTIVQIILIALMNTIEFFLVPDLLLFGKMNSVFALLLISIIYYTEFMLQPKPLTTE